MTQAGWHPSRTARPHVRLLLETVRPSPAYVVSRSMDGLAHSPGGLAPYAGIEYWPAGQRNLGRYLFLHPAARRVLDMTATRTESTPSRQEP
ncbi:hypothetical protein GCM10010343_08390 [Streptomyces avidinii]|nr:hypothetical protein GCM10010343_08390 [Streptomyces avidinii]